MSADVDPSAVSESRESQAPAGAGSPPVIAAGRDRFRQTALLVFAVALVIRLLALWAASDAELVKDEIAYAARANALLDGKGYLGSYQSWVKHDGWRIMDLPQYPGAYQPPGYPTFMAAIMAVSARSLVAVKLVQCLLSALSCVLLLRLGRAWFGERAGAIAGWLWALYPNAIAFSHLLWSETLFVFLLLALLDLLFGVGAAKGSSSFPSLRRCSVAGVVLALAALTRGTAVFLAPVLVFWMLLLEQGKSGLPDFRALAWRNGLLRGCLVLGVALICIAPWSVRNYGVHGGFVLIDTNAPYNLWRGNAPGAMALRGIPQAPRYSWPFHGILLHPIGNLNGRELIDAYRRDKAQSEQNGDVADPTDLEVMAYASEVAWQQIRHEPMRALRRAGWKLIDMWNPTSFLVRHLEMGAYGDVPPGLRGVLVFAAAASYLFVMFLALFGLLSLRGDRRVWLIAASVVYFSAISALAFGLTRFRMPLMPLFALMASVEMARSRSRADAGPT